MDERAAVGSTEKDGFMAEFDRDDPKKCPECSEKIDYRAKVISPLENGWEPFCPFCGWPDV